MSVMVRLYATHSHGQLLDHIWLSKKLIDLLYLVVKKKLIGYKS